MKKYEASLPSSESLDQQSLFYLPNKYFSSAVGAKHNKVLKEIIQSSKNINQTAMQTNSSLNSVGVEPEKNHVNELGAISLAVNYCLNTQSKIADTLSEIGQYLKGWNEDSSNMNLPSSHKQKQNHPTSSSAATIFMTNRTLNKQTDGVSKKMSLQSILVKIEALQRETNLRIRDFDSRVRGPEWDNANNAASENLQLEEIVYGAKLSVPYQKQRTSPAAVKLNIGGSSQKNFNIQQIPSQERLSSLPSEFPQKRRETLPDETLNFSRNNYDMQSTENSQIATLNLSVCGVETAKKQKITTQRKNPAPKLQLNLCDNKSTSTQVSNLAISERSPQNKLQNTVAIKLDLQPRTKNIQEKISKQMNQKKVRKEKKGLQKDYLWLQPKITIRQSASLERQYKANDKMNILSVRRRTAAVITAAKEVGFSSLETSPRELNFDFGIRKNSTRPDLNIVPQKEVIDDGAPDHTADHTMRKDNSILSAEENFPTADELRRSRSFDTERVYEPEEIDDLMQNPTPSFVKNTAKKEKLIIKTLMRDQVGVEAFPYQKANHGLLHQKKCLINARWWRAWKDFVNFDGTDNGTKQAQVFELGLYPRPGPINNRELIKQEVLLDLRNLTPELELKDNLLKHHDYEVVSKKVYDVLAKWYGFDFEICRMLKPDPFRENQPYLDLYPKKKPAVKANQASVDTQNSNSSSTVINSIINSNLSQP